MRRKLRHSTARERNGRREIKEFTVGIKLRLKGKLHFPNSKGWLSAYNLAQRIYGLSRDLTPPELFKVAAMVGAQWSPGILSERDVITVVTESLRLRGYVLRFAEMELIETTIEDRAAILAEGRDPVFTREGSMGTEVKSEKSERRSQSEEPNPVEQVCECAEDRERVGLTVTGLRERVRMYLSGRVEGVDPAEVAGELVDTVLAGSRQVPDAKGRSPDNGNGKQRERRKRPAQGSLVARATETTALESFGMRRAVKAVRLAVADKHPIVKRCVAERLFNHRGFDDLAELLNISRADVAATLTRMRGWVRKYTTYFNDDWFWDDSAPKFRLPDACPGRAGQTT